MENSPTQLNHWQEFWDELMERLRTPRRHPTFVFYFLGIIIFLGGFGLLLEPLVTLVMQKNWTTIDWIRLISVCYTYFVAIAATAAVDLILSLRRRKSLQMLFVLCCLVVFLCAVLAAIWGTFGGNAKAAAYPSVLGYILALFLWWVGNADNVNLLDTPPNPDVTTGGDTRDQPVGDLSDFNI